MKICFITPRFPYPVTKGDTLRAYHQIRELSRSNTLHLISLAQAPVPAEARAELERYCERVEIVRLHDVRSLGTVAVLGPRSRMPLQVLYFQSPALTAAVRRAMRTEHYDVVHAVTVRVAPAALAVRTAVPVVVDFMDSYAANMASRRQLAGPLMRRVFDLELRRVQGYERQLAGSVAGGIVIAQLDRETIGDPGLAVIPNGVDADAFPFFDGQRDPATLIFTGNMGYGPNVDAVKWFVARCWPLLRAREPALRLQIVGARPAPAVTALARLPGIEVTGRVVSMVPYLARATIAVCPIRCGSGMQNKLLEAMSTGAPVVTTGFANRGIGAMAGRHVQVAADAGEMVEAVLRLLAEPDLRRAQAHSAHAWVQQTYGWRAHTDSLVDVYRHAIARLGDVREAAVSRS